MCYKLKELLQNRIESSCGENTDKIVIHLPLFYVIEFATFYVFSFRKYAMN